MTPESFAIAGGRATFEAGSWVTHYYITDHLGSTRAVANASGDVFATFDYTPYGSLLNAEDTPTGTDYLFTGKENQAKQSAGELYDSQARFMDTGGRFLSIDPLAEKFYHLSPYAYCAGDPVNMVDPDGEAAKAIISAFKYCKRLYKVYRKKGRISLNALKEAGITELVETAGDLQTLSSDDASFGEKAIAVFDLALGSNFNKKGELKIAKELGLLKTHKHHLIPKAVYKKFPELKNILKRDGAENLIDIPEGFHGNHPQYSKWIENQINTIEGEITAEDIERIMNEAQEHIYKAYDKFIKDGYNLNDYFKEINKKIPPKK